MRRSTICLGLKKKSPQCRQLCLDFLLDGHRCDVLPSGCDDDLLDPAGDVEEPILVLLAKVSRVQPAIRVDQLGRLLLLPEISHATVSASCHNLAIQDLCLKLWVTLPNTALLRVDAREAGGHGAGRLGAAQELQHKHVQGLEMGWLVGIYEAAPGNNGMSRD